MESVADIRLQRGMEQELNKVEELLQSDSTLVLEQLGEKLTDWEQLVKATNDYTSALRIGDILEKLRQNWLALSWYQWITHQADTEGDVMTRVMRAKGRVQIRLGMYQEALPLLQQVEGRLIAEGKAESYDYAFTLQNIALVYSHLDRYADAVEYARTALQWFCDREDYPRASVMEFLIGTYLYNLQQYEQCYEYLVRSREGLEKHQDYFYLARCWHNYAELMLSLERKEEALAAWRMALEIKKRTSDYVGQVNTLLSVGSYLNSQEDWHGALRYITQAIALCHQYRLVDQEVACLHEWSRILLPLGRYSELEVCASRTKCLARHVSARGQAVTLLQKIAEDFERIGRKDLSEQYNRVAIQLLD